MSDPIKKTSNPIFSEGKDLHGVPPTPIRTDSMFDSKEQADLTVKKPSNDEPVNGQKNTGHSKRINNKITTPSLSPHDGLTNMYIYFENPGDYQGN
jgi:hypothetical protein